MSGGRTLDPLPWVISVTPAGEIREANGESLVSYFDPRPVIFASTPEPQRPERKRCSACGHWCVPYDDDIQPGFICSKRGGCGSEWPDTQRAHEANPVLIDFRKMDGTGKHRPSRVVAWSVSIDGMARAGVPYTPEQVAHARAVLTRWLAVFG